MAVVKMVIERTDTNMLNTDDTSTCLMIGLIISRVPPDTRTMRLKALYCSAMNLILVKRHYLVIHHESEFRSCLADILVDWIEKHLVSWLFLNLREANEVFTSHLRTWPLIAPGQLNFTVRLRMRS
jgi:hypothetical protein